LIKQGSERGMRYIFWIGFAGLVVAVLFLLMSCASRLEPRLPSSSLISDVSTPVGFQRAEAPLDWNFPKDFGPHPDYQTEWWYYTGNLESDQGDRFGYQLTIFRRALQPTEDRTDRESTWATEQIYMGHFALSDQRAGQHHAFERFSRGAAGLAGAQSEPYRVWLEDWQVSQSAAGEYQLIAEQDGIKLDLMLKDLKGPILHGDQGYSQKGPDQGNASHYYSQTRMQTSGSIQTNTGSYQVNGLSWKDHEFSTSALSSGQVGWDWFSIQLDDGSELMVFQIRREDGSIDPYSSGTLIDPSGEVVSLAQVDFEIQVEDSWSSPKSGAKYPSQWWVIVPKVGLELQIRPILADQEMKVSYTYWEGAVDVQGTLDGNDVSGSGYVEMTGYASSFEGEF
jgi:predicted secreted hydrolase